MQKKAENTELQKMKKFELREEMHDKQQDLGFPGRPLEDLYVWGLPDSPLNNHQFAFAGDDLCSSALFDDIKEFHMTFHVENEEGCGSAAWAHSLRANILTRLSGKDHCWYIGYRTERQMSVYDKHSEVLLDTDVPRLRMWELSELAFVDSGYRNNTGPGKIIKPIFEVRNIELEVFITEVWPKASSSFSIEGYCMPHGRLNLLRKWNKRERTAELFKEVIDECRILFFTSSDDHRDFHFITGKMDLDEFAKTINLNDLHDRVNEM